MKRHHQQILLGLGLLGLSIVLYVGLHALYPDRTGDIFFYTLLDIAFIPLSVVIVGLILNEVLVWRERRQKLERLDMLIGSFHSEVGTGLLGRLAGFDARIDEVRPGLRPTATWTAEQFQAAVRSLPAMPHQVDARRSDLAALRDFLLPRRPFILGLLENSSLLEHEQFTDLLWAVLHLAEELQFRERLDGLPEHDLDHLGKDVERAYLLLIEAWLKNMRHLKEAYPYLFSLAVRTNPFDPEARVEIP